MLNWGTNKLVQIKLVTTDDRDGSNKWLLLIWQMSSGVVRRTKHIKLCNDMALSMSWPSASSEDQINIKGTQEYLKWESWEGRHTLS